MVMARTKIAPPTTPPTKKDMNDGKLKIGQKRLLTDNSASVALVDDS